MKVECYLSSIVMLISCIAMDAAASEISSRDEIEKNLRMNCGKRALENLRTMGDTHDSVLKAKALFLAGKNNSAFTVIHKALTNDKHNPAKLGLGAAIAMTVNRPQQAIDWLKTIEGQDPKSYWATLEIYRISGDSNETLIYTYCTTKPLPADTLLSCSKLIKHNPTLKKDLLDRTIHKASLEINNPFKNIIIAKALEGKGQQTHALQEINKIEPTSTSYIHALREKARLHGALGQYQNGQKALEILLSKNPVDPINRIVAYDFYKKFHQPFMALHHLSEVGKCTFPSWDELKRRIGYISEAIGVPIATDTTVQLLAMSFFSHFRVEELVQNRSQNLPLNLYSFRSQSISIGATKRTSPKTSFFSRFNLIEKGGTQNERDHIVSLGINRNYFFSSLSIDSQLQATSIPVYDNEKREFVRNSFILSKTIAVRPYHGKRSYHLDLRHGTEYQLQNDNTSSFFESRLLINNKLRELKIGLPIGIEFKETYGEFGLSRIKFLFGINKEINSNLFINLFNELSWIPEKKTRVLSTSIEATTPVNETTNLKLRFSNDQDLSYNFYQQQTYSLNIEKNWYLKNNKVKGVIEFNHLRNLKLIQNNLSFINFKIGVPL